MIKSPSDTSDRPSILRSNTQISAQSSASPRPIEPINAPTTSHLYL